MIGHWLDSLGPIRAGAALMLVLTLMLSALAWAIIRLDDKKDPRPLQVIYALVIVALCFLFLTGCGRQAPPAEPDHLGFTDPVLETECAGHHPCWCENMDEAWAQAANHATFAEGYQGNGARVVTLALPDSALIHVYPQGACGDLLAASGLCWCQGSNFREHEIVRRSLHQFGPVATFRLVPGHGYWATQGALVVPIPAIGDTIRVDSTL